jgi:hypothetical protein
MVDQLGECLRIGFVSNVQRCKPIQLPSSCAGAGFSHLGDAEIDTVGEYSGEQQHLILRRLACFQMSEVLAEPGPAIDFRGGSPGDRLRVLQRALRPFHHSVAVPVSDSSIAAVVSASETSVVLPLT